LAALMSKQFKKNASGHL